ncbi:MAG TPA: DNA repair protein RecO [Clostridiales bacterium]|nr:DNA repair protein RecO [Clostridiales bacterium]
MAHVTVKGLVIRETDFGETDRFITVLTAELGKIEVLCRGIRRRKGRLANAVRLFCYSEFTLYSGKSYTLSDAETDMSFWGITSNIEQYALCCYFAELVNLSADSDDTSGGLLPMFLRALYALDRQKRPVQTVKAAFELRLAADLGYAPDLTGCAVCGQAECETWSFLLENGALVCSDCRKRVGGTYFDLPQGVLTAMRYIVSCDGKRLFAFAVSEQTGRQLGQICERYLLFHLDVRCTTLDFYHSLFQMESEQ